MEGIRRGGLHPLSPTLLLPFAVFLLARACLTPTFAGTVVAWGDFNSSGGDAIPSDLGDCTAVAAGEGFTLAVKADTTVTNWGSGFSAPGTGAVPPGISNIVAVAAGQAHGVALRQDGTVCAWGDNSVGQTNVPVGLSNVVAIAAGRIHSLALKRDGTVVAWGSDTNGGYDVGQARVPVEASNVVAISAGTYHNLALRNDGSVVTWGDAFSGQSVVLQDLSDIAAIAAGGGHSLVLRKDGTVMGWGYNLEGILTPPADLSNVVSIAAGGWLSVAVQRSGGVVPWGDDNFGTLLVPPAATNVYALSANFWHCVVLTGSQPPPISTEPLFIFPLPVTSGVTSERTTRPIVGSSIQLCPANFGAMPLQYQWQLNGTNLPGATNLTLTFSALQQSQSGDYALVTTNAFGISGKAIVHLMVAPLEITTQPRGQSGLGGTNIQFDVTANGIGPFYYQWFYEGLPIGGATNASLILTNVFPTQSGRYAVVVSNSYGAITSSDAILQVAPFQITAQPQSQSALGGTNIQMQVALAGLGPFSFQWHFNGTNLAGGTNSVLMLNNVAPSDSGTYSVVVSNIYGALVSSNALLTVAPFAITRQPFSLSTYTGATIAFSVTAAGQAPFVYQWQFNGTNVLGVTSNLLMLTNIGLNQLGVYRVIVSNNFGQIISSNATLSLSEIAAWGDNSQRQLLTPPDLTNAVFISAGYYHGLALKADRTVVAWGGNEYGQTNVPTGLTDIVAVSAGSYHNLAVRSDGTVVAWGRNDFGESSVPEGLSNVVAVATGSYHSVALKADGTVLVWGWNIVGQLNVPAGLSNVVAIAAGRAFSLALKSDGTVVPWGYYQEGNVPPGLSNVVAIADGDLHHVALKSDGTVVAWGGDNTQGQENVPTNLTDVVAIAANGYHTLVLKRDNTMVSWGDNVAPQTNSIQGAHQVAMIACGASFNFALLPHGPPFAWSPSVHLSIMGGQTVYIPAIVTGLEPSCRWSVDGYHLAGRTNASLSLIGTQAMQGTYTLVASNTLGTAFTEGPQLTIVPLLITNQPQNQSVLAGMAPSFGVGVKGWTPLTCQWRYNGTNLTGATNLSLVLSNVQPSQAGLYSVAVSNAFGGAISSNALLTVTPLMISSQPQNRSTFLGGSAQFNVTATLQGPFTYQWRFNGGNISGATNNPLVLTNAQLSQAGMYSVAVDNGLGSVVSSNALLTVSQVAAWGNNQNGQVNLPSTLTNAVTVASGASHNLALKSDGTVIAWGSNASGQTNVPAGLTDVIAIAGGGSFSLALRSNGTVRAWGSNANQLTNVPPTMTNIIAIAAGSSHWLAVTRDGTVVGRGLNTSGQISVPPGLGDVVSVAAGGSHSLALKSDGTVVGWGMNQYGQTNVPGGLSNVVAIAAGLYHSLALRSDGTVVAWGNNGNQQTNVPVNLTAVMAIAAGGYHSLALRGDGSVVAWGYNGWGQTNVPAALGPVQAISAGLYHSLALVNNGKPAVVRPPLGRVVYAGSDITVSCAAIGAPPLHYQWQFNGTNVDGELGPTLTLTNVPLSVSGNYACIISNLLGTAATPQAVIGVLRGAPQFSSNLQFGPAGLTLQLSGLSGHGPVVIYSSTNLLEWNAVLTNPPIIGQLQLLDSSATSVPTRFYRAVEQ